MGKLSIRYIVIFLGLIFIASPVKPAVKNKKKRISVLPVPTIGYSPETKTYIGAVTLFTIKSLNDTTTRTSNADIEINYTWNKQLIFESGWNYFFPKENWFTKGIIHYSKYPDLYYGIGAKTSENNKTNFQSNRLALNLDVFRKLKNNIFLGLGFVHKRYYDIKYLGNGIKYPELINSKTSGLKIIFLNDNRDNILSPSTGSFFEFNNSFNSGSDFYFITKADYRKYFNFGSQGKNVVACRFFHSSIIGEPPFYDYAIIGGDGFARGYYLGRFRDKNFTTTQVEFRSKIFWRVGMAVFGGISAVYNNISSFSYECLKPNAGLGLRFLIDKKENTNLRIDYALGSGGQNGFYISFGESF